MNHETRIPERLDRLPWSSFHTRLVIALGITWVLDGLEVTRGADIIATYSFNTGVAKHHFCPRCGIHVYHQPRSDPSIYAINAAALDGVCPYADFPDANVNDGVHHQKDHGGTVRSAGRLKFEANEDWASAKRERNEKGRPRGTAI